MSTEGEYFRNLLGIIFCVFIIYFVFVDTAQQSVPLFIRNFQSQWQKENTTGEPLNVNATCNGEQWSFPVYENGKIVKTGKMFNCNLYGKIKEWGLLDAKLDKPFEPSKVVIVTYSSANHFAESKAGLLNVRNSTNNTIIYYDLGLYAEQVKELKVLCNIKYVKFNFSTYPAHVKQLGTYAFKAIIAAEVYKSHDAFWMFDASLRIVNKPLLEKFYSSISKDPLKKFAALGSTHHSIFAATYKGAYTYLPLLESKQNQTMRLAVMFAAKSPFTTEVIKWITLCALTKECIAPSGATLMCNFRTGRYGGFANCHRYDQSALNIVLSSMLEKFGHSELLRDGELIFDSFLRVDREKVYNGLVPHMCPLNRTNS